jgi:Tn7-like transposition protein D
VTDKFTFTIVQSYGASWEDLLLKLWDDKAINTNKITRKLGVSLTTLKRRVVALGLRFPRWKDAAGVKVEINDRYKPRRQSKKTLLQKKKGELLSLIAKNPRAGRSELWGLAGSLLLYLQRAEPQWLDHHLPPRKQAVPRPPEVDWANEDTHLAKAIANAIVEINRSDVPTRISVKAIAKRVGHLNRIRKYLDRMPQTARILNAHLESSEDFLVGRIGCVEEAFRRERIIPTKTASSVRALICRYVVAGNEVVCQAMEDALSRPGSVVRESKR